MKGLGKKLKEKSLDQPLFKLLAPGKTVILNKVTHPQLGRGKTISSENWNFYRMNIYIYSYLLNLSSKAEMEKPINSLLGI